MNEKIKICGKQKICGDIVISGAKNSALPLLAASLLSESTLSLSNVPDLLDISTMLDLLESLGVACQWNKNNVFSGEILLKTDAVNNFTAPYEIVKRMRASILVLGPLLTRFGRATVSLPGGCAIGIRPINFHIEALEAMGAKINLENGYLHASALHGLRGAEYTFPVSSVTGTENTIMAATLANGTTVIKNAAKEPEIIDLVSCLNKMGAKITGEGTDVITIVGVSSLNAATHAVLPDRIEAGSYAIAAGITKGNVNLLGGDFYELLPTFIPILSKAGLIFEKIDNGLSVKSCGEIYPVDVFTAPYPGFPTDLQAQTMALLCFASGVSTITENIWENRYMHVSELARMGVDIEISGAVAKIFGTKHISGATLVASDLRASFGLILAAIAATGDSIIEKIYHLDRGYCKVVEKLSGCNIKIERFMEE